MSCIAPIEQLSKRIAWLLGHRVQWRKEPATTRVFMRVGNPQHSVVQMDLTDVQVLMRVDDTALRAFLDSRGLGS